MTRRLGGWWRMWIAASGVWALVVATLVYLIAWPTIESVPHSDDFITSMSVESLSVIGGGNPFSAPGMQEGRGESRPKYRDPDIFRDLPSKRDQRVVEQPNGYLMTLPAGTSDKQAIQVSIEYTQKLSEIVAKDRWNALGKGLLIWILPSLALLLIGLATRWIYNGFKGQSS